MNIDILMATYNGEKYIENQLLSLLMQTHEKWRLLIHDDGSTDKTVAIIKKFQELDSRIELVEDNICYHDPAYNFLHLLQYSKADFLMFCDQDDIWLERKLEIMLDAIRKEDNTKPQAVYSNSFVYDESENRIEGFATLTYPKNLNQLLFMNGGIQGCAIIFNRMLKNICIDIPKNVCMHDHFISLAAVTFGKFTYLDQRLMLYRRHSGTVTGRTPKRLGEKIKPFFDSKRSVIDRKHYNAVSGFYEKNEYRMDSTIKEVFKAYFMFPKQNKIKRILSIFANNFIIFDNRIILLMKVLLRKGIN
ncbi:MAG: glycosyltransferase family 2 protein [Bacteroidaceae bacterium]